MKQILSTLLVTTFLLALPKILYCQQQSWNWHFGNQAGLSFNNGNPTALLNSAMSAGEGCASISDSIGNLLFYTDGITVYNANHVIMVNGSGLTGGGSSSQSAIILKKPGSQKIYYIFTVDENFNNGENGLRYSIVNMALNNGLGGIDSANKNMLVRGRVMERLTAARHRNGSDFWIIITDFSEDEIFAYRLTCSGLNPVPVKSNVGPFFLGDWRATFGYMKVSKQNNRIAMAGWYNRSFLVFDFNNSTGLASNRINITSSLGKIDNYTYGVEFSPNGNLLYGTTIDGPRAIYANMLINKTMRLFQFNLSYGTGNIIGDSLKVIASHLAINSNNYSGYYGALQLGPDGKMYSADRSDTLLGLIKYPDSLGTACGYSNTVRLGGRTSGLGLPNILISYLLPVYDTANVSICPNGSYILCNGTVITSPGIYTCHYSTATSCDSISVVKVTLIPTDTTVQYISACPPYNWYGQNIVQSDIYYHTLASSLGCDSVIQLNININSAYRDTFSKSICQDDTFWGYSTSGYYTRLFQTIHGCDSSVTVYLTVVPVTITYEAATICQGDNLSGHTQTGMYTDTLAPCTYRILMLTVKPVQTDTLIRTICRGDSLFGHTTQGDYLDTISQCHYRFLRLFLDDIPIRPIPVDTVLCQGITLKLKAGLYIYNRWDDGTSNSTRSIIKSGKYSISIGNLCDTLTFYCNVLFRQCEIKIPNAFSPNGDGINDVWVIQGLQGYPDCHVQIFDRYERLVFNNIGYNIPWNGKLGIKNTDVPIGTYYYVITAGTAKHSGSVTIIR